MTTVKEKMPLAAFRLAVHAVVWWVRNTNMKLQEAVDYVQTKNQVPLDQADRLHSDAEKLLADTICIFDTVLVRLSSVNKSKLITKKGKRVLLIRTGVFTQRELWNIYNQPETVAA